MNKPKKVRGSAPLKTIAFLLALVLAAGICACVGSGIAAYRGSSSNQSEEYLTEQAYALAERLPEYLFLYLHRYALTQEGMGRFAQLRREFMSSSTNFRYTIRMSDGTQVMGNTTATAFDEDDRLLLVDSEIYDGYQLGRNRMLSYYLNVDEVHDWTIGQGTSRDWANTAYASDYYYNLDDIDSASDATADGAARVVIYGDVISEGGADWDGEEPAMEDPETDEEEANSGAAGREYYFFVYTGSFPRYYVTYGVDTSGPVNDTYTRIMQQKEENRSMLEARLPLLQTVLISCAVCFTLLLVWLTLAVGWNREGELALRGLNRMPIEAALLFAAACVVAAAFVVEAGYSWQDNMLTWLAVFGFAGLIGALGALTLWLVAAAQLKTSSLRRRSLIWRLLKWIWGCWGKLRQLLRRMALQWPLYWKVGLFCVAYWVAYLVYVAAFAIDGAESYGLIGYLFFFTLPIVPLAGIACKWALDWARMRRAVKEMVAGQMDCAIDTSHMLPDLKAHGDDLSNLSAGLSKAVEERTRSERFKTELITNVSHDLKTPLTSIINYVDLLKKLDITDETARGYIDVLDRKSQRLKTLTEDLVEASKAASGTIGVHPERLDVSQLLEQAVAEYDERLEQSGLTAVVSTPEGPCTVMADGRHLWRVLDNLLGNCTKYAMPGTRVYLDVEKQSNRCVITVKNISADPLNIPAEDLLKRFVRGDSARSTEGSGLGLSIARNLTGAQGGSFDLVVDGDLFKAIVTFPLAAPDTPSPKLSVPETAQLPTNTAEAQ